MTVKGLWPLLQPTARPVKLESLRNKRLAIDASIWLHQFLRAMRDKEGNALRNAHILGFFRRICKLLFYNIKPVFVFDGGAPTLKRATIAHRRRRRADVVDTLKKTAEKILVAQMQLRAVKDFNKLRTQELAGSNDEDNEQAHSPGGIHVLDENEPDVSLPISNNLDEQQQSIAQLIKKRKRDEYDLPPIQGIKSLIQREDPRFATDEELRLFINDFKPEELDMDSDVFRSLPTEIQYEIITDLKLKSRQTSWDRLQEMVRRAPSSFDFSKLQIEHLMHRNDMTQRLFEVTGIVSKATGTGYGVAPVRIAGERDREYVLVKNDDPDSGLGWSLPKAKRIGSKARPVRIDDSDDEETIAADKVETEERDLGDDDDLEFESVEVPGVKEDKVLKAIQASVKLQQLTTNMELPVKSTDEDLEDDDEPLFLPVEKKRKTLKSHVLAEEDTISVPSAPSFTIPNKHSIQNNIDAFMNDDATIEEVMERFRILEQQKANGGDLGVPDNRGGDRDWSMSPDPGSDHDRVMGFSPPQGDDYDADSSLVPSVDDQVENDGEDRGSRLGDSGYNNLAVSRNPFASRSLEGDEPTQSTSDLQGEHLMNRTQFHELWLSRAASTRNFSILYPDNQERGRMLHEPMVETIAQVEEKLKAVHRRLMKLNSSDKVKLEGLEFYERFLTKAIEWKKFNTERAEKDMDDEFVEQVGEPLYLDSGAEVLAQESPKHDEVIGAEGHIYLDSNFVFVTEDEIAERESFGFMSNEFDDDFGYISGEDKENVIVGQDDKENFGGLQMAFPSSIRRSEARIQVQEARAHVPPRQGHGGETLPEFGVSHGGKASICETTEGVDGDEQLRFDANDAKMTGASPSLMSMNSSCNNESIIVRDDQNIVLEIDDASEVKTLSSTITPPNELTGDIYLDHDEGNTVVEVALPTENDGNESLDDYISDEETLPSNLTAENEEFARFVSELSNKDLHIVQVELDSDLRQLNETQRKAKRDADDLTKQMVSECQELLRLFGIPYLVSPMEAEAQCAELMRLGLVDGIVTDDSDVFLFGGLRVYKNMFNQSRFVECYLLQDLEREMQLSRDKLVDMAYLLGSDYTEGLPGVGPVSALEILNEFGQGLDGLKNFKEWWEGALNGFIEPENSLFKKKFRKAHQNDVTLADDFPNPLIREAYFHPTVDSSETQFQWGFPDLDSLREYEKPNAHHAWWYLMVTLAWQQVKVDEVLLPVIKQLNAQKLDGVQKTIDSFFDHTASMETYTPLKGNRAHKSKRVQNIVNQWKTKKGPSSVSIDDDSATTTDDQNKRRPSSEAAVSPNNRGRTSKRSTKAATKGRSKQKNRSHVDNVSVISEDEDET
ncbi:hypothetical protein BC937DRAFT_89766 [Endogone sp. FLAS-F59071]|nr:hypothetical protein BC937DRAFT_89766 [Endogone sp. FLAS-F59071]|eukprot:RUS22293.1 hypothetical protein BC937DRAFT_89766 [Endogone sp. FLAS-F59071]